MTHEELLQEKAKRLRYKKPVVRNINLDAIREGLCEVQEACSDVQWYMDSEDGSETLLNAIEDEDDLWEFKMSFAVLQTEAEKMASDLEETYVPDCFDLFFCGIGAQDVGGGMLGYDEYEGDYFGLDVYGQEAAEKEAAEKLKRLTKAELIDAMSVCFRIAISYVGLRARYDDLKAAMEILRGQNTALLQQIREIDDAYNKAAENDFDEWIGSAAKKYDALLRTLPDRLWLE